MTNCKYWAKMARKRNFSKQVKRHSYLLFCLNRKSDIMWKGKIGDKNKRATQERISKEQCLQRVKVTCGYSALMS